MKPIKTALLALPLLAAGCNRDSGTAKSGRWRPEASGSKTPSGAPAMKMGTRHRRRHAQQVRRERPGAFRVRRRRFRKFRPRSIGCPRYRPPRGAALVRRAGVRDDPGDIRPAGTTSRPGAQSPCRRLHRPHRSGTKERSGRVRRHQHPANGGQPPLGRERRVPAHAARRLQRRHAHRSRGTLLRSHG